MNDMTSRERFRKALNHQEPDRVPIDVGQDFHNGIHEVAYRNLLAYLGEEDDIRLYDRIQHLAVCKESILERLHADTRYVFANAPSNWQIKVHADSSWADEWGVVRKNVGLYDESIQCPLAGASIDEIKSYQMPDPVDPARFTGLKERAKELYEGTQYAIIGGSAASLFYLSSELMGFQEYMERLALEPQVIEILVDRILEWEIQFFEKYLEQVGKYVELVWMGDDWGMQSGPIMNPKIFKKYLCLVIRIYSFCKIQNPSKNCFALLRLSPLGYGRFMKLELMSFTLCKRLPLIWGIRKKSKRVLAINWFFIPTFPINPSFPMVLPKK